MKRLFAMLVMACCLNASAVELAGVQLDDTAKVGGQELVLNGAGIRIKYAIVKAYVGGLYMPKKTQDAEAVISSSSVRRMHLVMLRRIQTEDLYKSLVEGMENNATPAEMTALEPKMKQMKEGFDTFATVEKGDIILMDFLPGKGTLINVKGKPWKTIEGDDFSRALLRIWFGKKPIQDDFKSKLLGG